MLGKEKTLQYRAVCKPKAKDGEAQIELALLKKVFLLIHFRVWFACNKGEN